MSLLDTNHPVPGDCNLLVVAGPRTPLDETELAEIDRYLTQGGRLLALFSVRSLKNGDTGLEKVLAKWGINVTSGIVHDPDRHRGDQDVIVEDFSPTHPVMNPLMGLALHMIEPRAVGKLHSHAPVADAPTVDELAFSGPKSYVEGE